MDDFIRPHTFVAIRLPSGLHKIVNVVPDTVISLGKFGAFNSNAILDRPFYVTFEILDQTSDSVPPELRLVPAGEIHAETLFDDPSAAESRDDAPSEEQGTEVVEQDGQLVVRNNRQTVDDPTRQGLSMAEIEDLKKSAVGSGKDIVTKIMESHSAIGEKTAYSLAKYIVRKTKKYMKRFTVLPLDVSTLAHYMLHERDAGKVLEVREEMLGLIASWSNVHFSIPLPNPEGTVDVSPKAGRWLVVDDAAGLIVALLAERMGTLHPREPLNETLFKSEHVEGEAGEDIENGGRDTEPNDPDQKPVQNRDSKKRVHPEDEMDVDSKPEGVEQEQPPSKRPRPTLAPDPIPADSNTITLVHAATQPNLSLLSFFSYDANANITSNVATPIQNHPLYNNLKTLSWLQLISPEEDTACIEPEPLTEPELAGLKSSKRGAYYRKRRRWERAQRTVDETRAGGFDGLVVATTMDLAGVLHQLVPLLRGGAPIAVFSPHAEPLVDLADQCSSQRRSAFINALYDESGSGYTGDDATALAGSEDFPFDPRLVLAPSLQTVRAREWQVLPGRTHPKMTSLGGPEGFLFTGIRAIPSEDRAEARGVFSKKKKKRPDAADGVASPLPAQSK